MFYRIWKGAAKWGCRGAYSFVALLVFPNAQALAQDIEYQIDAQPTDSALLLFAEASGIQITFSPADAGKTISGGVSGAHSREQALQQILEGTDLKYTFMAEDFVIVRANQEESPVSTAPHQLASSTLLARLQQAEPQTQAQAQAQAQAQPQVDTGGSDDDQVIEEVIATGRAVQDLDLTAVTDTGSRLGLSGLETPASVDIIDSETMRMRGLKSVTEAAESLAGVLSGEAPGEPSSFSMRGFQQNQITVLRDGLRAGPANMTMRPQNTFNLERVEILKGPASVLYGEGAVAGTVNMVTKKPTLGNDFAAETLLSYGRYNTWEAGLGVEGPAGSNSAYRIDASTAASDGWVDRADSRSTNVTAAILWAPREDLELLVTGDYLDDDLPSYWGTPFVTEAFAGDNAMREVVSSADMRTIDRRTRFISYNVGDHVSESDHFWGRFHVAWDINENTRLRNQAYHFTADRRWINSEQYPFNAATQQIDRDRFFVLHDQQLYGNRLDLVTRSQFGDRESTFVIGIDMSNLDFDRSRGFPDGDSVDVLNPTPGSFGPLDRRLSPTKIDTVALFVENQFRVTETFSIVSGLRYDDIDLVRDNFGVDGSFIASQSFARNFQPFSWRIGAVYEVNPLMVAYGQFSTAQDPPSSANIFLVNANRNFGLSDAGQWEVGLKSQLDGLGGQGTSEITVSIYGIDRDNILTQVSQTEVSTIGNQESQGLEISFSTDATDRWRIGGNASYINSSYGVFVDPDFGIDASGNRPPNVPDWAINLWTSVSDIGGLPLEIGGGLRHISDRFANTSNVNKMLSYTIFDAFGAYVFGSSRLMVRVRNATDEEYAPWADVFYPNQIVLGSPRTYEVSLHTQF